MSIFHTTANGAGPTWRQLGDTDYGAIGFTTVVDVSAALLMSHVVCEASWPVYAATIPQIVVFSSLAVSCRMSHPGYVHGEQRVGCRVRVKLAATHAPGSVCCPAGCVPGALMSDAKQLILLQKIPAAGSSKESYCCTSYPLFLVLLYL